MLRTDCRCTENIRENHTCCSESDSCIRNAAAAHLMSLQHRRSCLARSHCGSRMADERENACSAVVDLTLVLHQGRELL